MTEKIDLEDAISAAAVTKELKDKHHIDISCYNIAMKTLWPAPT